MRQLNKQFTGMLESVQREATPGHNFALMLNAPPQISQALDDVRRRYDPAFKVGIPPHITLKRPAPLEKNENIAKMQEGLRPVALTFPPIEVQLQGYGVFKSPGRNVVFLKVQREKPFCQLHMQALQVLSQIYPGGQADHYEGEHYHPHLTIANELSELDLAVLEYELASGGYQLDFSFVLDRLTLCVGQFGQPWQDVEVFQLAGSIPDLTPIS